MPTSVGLPLPTTSPSSSSPAALRAIGGAASSSAPSLAPSDVSRTVASLSHECSELTHGVEQLLTAADSIADVPEERRQELADEQSRILDTLQAQLRHLQADAIKVEEASPMELRRLTRQIDETGKKITLALERIGPSPEALLANQITKIEQGHLDYSVAALRKASRNSHPAAIARFCDTFHTCILADLKETKAQLHLANKSIERRNDADAYPSVAHGLHHWRCLSSNIVNMLQLFATATPPTQ